jgi:hypothetical protein
MIKHITNNEKTSSLALSRREFEVAARDFANKRQQIRSDLAHSFTDAIENDNLTKFNHTLDLAKKELSSLGALSLNKIISKKTGDTLLHWIVKNNHANILKEFLDGDSSFFSSSFIEDASKRLPLYYAITYKPSNPQDIKDNNYIIENLINMDDYICCCLDNNHHTQTPIGLAYAHKKDLAVKLLFQQGCNTRELPEEEKQKLIEEARAKLPPYSPKPFPFTKEEAGELRKKM